MAKKKAKKAAKKKTRKATKKESVRETTMLKRAGKRHDVGVLFVHGIGEQHQGDTLIRFAEPVIKWIKEWVASRPGHNEGSPEPVRIIESVLGKAQLKPGAPGDVRSGPPLRN